MKLETKHLLKLTVLGLMAGCPFLSHANGFALPDQDAFATARGEAVVATADNSSAIFYNPAGITQLEGHNLRGGVYLLNYNTSFKPPTGAPNAGKTYDAEDDFAAVPRFFYTYSPTNLPVAFGLGVYSPFGGKMSWPQDTGFRSVAIGGELTYITINPVVAWKILPSLSIAAGPMVNYVDLKMHQGLDIYQSPRNYYRFSGDGWSVGANAGIRWQPLDQLAFGAMFRSPAEVKLDGQADFERQPRIQKSSRSADMNLTFPMSAVGGVTNVQFSLDASGIPMRYAISNGNVITIDTRYNFNGAENLYFKTISKPTVYNVLDSQIDNGKLSFITDAVLPLNFNNPVFLAYASDVASLEVGQNDVDFYTTENIDYTATFTDLETGRVLKTLTGSASEGYIYLIWDFTELDGVTPFTNESYVVQFDYTPTTLVAAAADSGGIANAGEASGGGGGSISITNKIDDGVRIGAGCFITYQEEDPGDSTGSYWNDKADTWARQTLRLLYTDQYKSTSLTQYETFQVGTNRNHANCVPLGAYATHWSDFMPVNLTNKNYSDLTIAGAHCDGDTIGYSKAYYSDKFNTYDLNAWLGNKGSGSKWRLRKAAIWGCWSGEDTGSLPFPMACGIRPTPQQMTTYCKKNAGFFFRGPVPQVWISSGFIITTAQAATMLDMAFMCGANPYPGGCDPTYSIRWAVQSVINQYPEMDMDPKTGTSGVAMPTLFGCPKLIYTTTLDHLATMLNFTGVKEN